MEQKTRPYRLFFPLIRLKGHLFKMHILKLSNYPRYVYLNPIEGVLITYKTSSKFPHIPHNIMNLSEITNLEFMREHRWYFTNGCYYFRVETKDKAMVFFDNNLDVINFWVNQITQAKKFYDWLQKLITFRYSGSTEKELQKGADEIITAIL